MFSATMLNCVSARSFIFATEIGLDLHSFYTAHIVKPLMFTSLRNQFGAYFSSFLARLARLLVVMAEMIICCKFCFFWFYCNGAISKSHFI